MNRYYKGNLFLVSKNKMINKINGYKVNGNIVDYKNNQFYKLCSNLPKEEQTHVAYIITNDHPKNTITDPHAIKILNQMFENLTFYYNKEINIIYEVIQDTSGNFYGKELLTGLLFPLFDRCYEFMFSYDIIDDVATCWINKGHCYRPKNAFSSSDVLFDEQGKEFLVNFTKFNSNWRQTIFGHGIEFTVDLCCLEHFTFSVEPNVNFSNAEKCECLIKEVGIADANEILAYQKMFEKGFNRKGRKRRFEETLKRLANKNIYKEEIIPKQETIVVREKQNNMTSLMENIEFLLMKLAKVNHEAYLKYQQEYEELLNGKNKPLNIKTLTVASLSVLEANIEFSLYFNKANANGIYAYLNKVKEEYLTNLLANNDQKTSLTLQELEKINELFLKVKNEYNLIDQRTILKNIAFLYLMELKENIDNIDIEQLNNSYIQDNLKSIMIWIETLERMGLIKENILIDLNHELTLSNILQIIRNIEFIKVKDEKVKALVKTI